MSASNHSSLRTNEERMKGFWIHLFFYLLVNAGLMALDLSKAPEKTWFYWPLGGWGIGLICHACAVFNCRRREQSSQGAAGQPTKTAHDGR
jgi:hypothetical protein